MAATSDLEKVRRICLALPETSERLSHGAPTFFIKEKKTFLTFLPDGHHDLDFPHLVCAAPPGAAPELIELEPERFFRPPYVGHRGWLGLRMDVDLDWDEVAELCKDAYRTVAPPKLAAMV